LLFLQARNQEYTDVTFHAHAHAHASFISTTTKQLLLINKLAVASAHKSVLASRSPVFAGMFKGNTEEARSGVVRMDGVTVELLVAFIELVYLGTLLLVVCFCMYGVYMCECIHGFASSCTLHVSLDLSIHRASLSGYFHSVLLCLGNTLS
jgi:hypothetical protein